MQHLSVSDKRAAGIDQTDLNAQKKKKDYTSNHTVRCDIHGAYFTRSNNSLFFFLYFKRKSIGEFIFL